MTPPPRTHQPLGSLDRRRGRGFDNRPHLLPATFFCQSEQLISLQLNQPTATWIQFSLGNERDIRTAAVRQATAKKTKTAPLVFLNYNHTKIQCLSVRIFCTYYLKPEQKKKQKEVTTVSSPTCMLALIARMKPSSAFGNCRWFCWR